MKQKLLATSAVLLGTILSACGGYANGFVAYGPPPPPRYAVVGVAPGPGYVWVDGYYNRYGNDWRWVNGRWALPPRGYRVWVRSEWRNEGGRWRFHEGRWRR
jgi:hypothetical protein